MDPEHEDPAEQHESSAPKHHEAVPSQETRPPSRPEVIVGLVTPVGVNSEAVSTAIKEAFKTVDYVATPLKISELIKDAAAQRGITFPNATSQRERLMSMGTALRHQSGDGAIAAMLAIWAKGKLVEDNQIEHYAHRPNAFVFRSLKHFDEVEYLRQVYGSRLLLIGATAPRDTREKELQRTLKDAPNFLSAPAARREAVHLLDRDQSEPETELGQQVQKAFPEADAFVEVPSDGAGVEEAMRRVVRLFFGDPWHTPTQDELAMFHAYAASLRSAALPRQVGCSIMDQYGEIVATGTNEAPKAKGGEYWEGDQPDGRTFAVGRETTDVYNEQLLYELLDKMNKKGWLSEEKSSKTPAELLTDAKLPDAPADDSGLLDVLEFGREVHAEMAALMTAARRGVSVAGCTLFSTTFPCHVCARLIVASGISRVVYRAPYPKSRAGDLYGDSVAIDEEEAGQKVRFEPFVGVAPSLFPRVFDAGKRKDPETGRPVEWNPTEATPRLGPLEEGSDYWVHYREEEAVSTLEGLLRGLDRDQASSG